MHVVIVPIQPSHGPCCRAAWEGWGREGRQPITDLERKLLALPARHGGLGVPVPTRTASNQFKACTEVTAPLEKLICQRNSNYPKHVQLEQRQTNVALRTSNRGDTTKEAEALKPKLPAAKQKAMEQASEKGASSWLTATPWSKYGFNLHKQASRDALCLRFGWSPARLDTHCPCGQTFSISHAFSCPKGAMPPIRHNGIRDITAQLLTEVCLNVGVEPTLQPLSVESFPLRSTNTEGGENLTSRPRTSGTRANKHRCQNLQLPCTVELYILLRR